MLNALLYSFIILNDKNIINLSQVVLVEKKKDCYFFLVNGMAPFEIEKGSDSKQIWDYFQSVSFSPTA